MSICLSSSDQENKYSLCAVLAATIALGVLSYQANLFLLPAYIAASRDRSIDLKLWLKQWIFILLLALFLAGSVFVFQAIQFANIKSFEQFCYWFVFKHGGVEYGLWRREGLPLFMPTVTAWLATIFPIHEGMRLRSLFQGNFIWSRIPAQVGLFSFFGMTTYLIFNAVKASIQDDGLRLLSRNLFLACIMWFFIPGLAVFWFDRAEIKLWIIPTFAIWILLALIMDYTIKERMKEGISQHAFVILILCICICIASSNFTLAIWPNYKKSSVEIQKARHIIPKLSSKDILLTSSFDWTAYVKYFCPNCRVLNILTLAQKLPPKNRQKVLIMLNEIIDATLSNEGNVYMVEYLGRPENSLWENWIIPYTGIDSEAFSAFEKHKAWEIENETIWYLLPNTP